MSYFPALRRDYILWRLATFGEVQRGDIMRTFGTSEAQSTGDMKGLLDDHPEIVRYDKTRKRYVPARRHQPAARLAKIADALGWE